MPISLRVRIIYVSVVQTVRRGNFKIQAFTRAPYIQLIEAHCWVIFHANGIGRGSAEARPCKVAGALDKSDFMILEQEMLLAEL